jgi:alkylation response protein AidB-like acyl-CoA dehydrogenase
MQVAKRTAIRRTLGLSQQFRRCTTQLRPTSMLMDPTSDLNEDQTMLFDMAYKFAEVEMRPYAAEWDEKKECPYEILRQCTELGFGGLYIPEESGGTGLSRHDTTLVIEALSTADVSSTALLTIHNMTGWMLDKFGSDNIKEKYLPPMMAGELFGSYCLTEASSGSDAASLKTTATRKNGKIVLNGSKSFISGAGFSDLYFVMCRTGDNSAKGISCVLVEKDTPGLNFGAQEKKMGWHCSPTAQVFFDNVEVPEDNLVGDEGKGFNIAMMGLDGGRLNIAATSLGAAHRCFTDAMLYCQERKQFGKQLSQISTVQFSLAEMATKLYTSRLVLRSAAKSLDENEPGKTAKCAMAKKFVTDAGFEICNAALQLHGGYGYLKVCLF